MAEDDPEEMLSAIARLRKEKLKSAYRDTDVGIWGFSQEKLVYKAFRMLDLSRYRKFMDLGSGDGTVVFIASLFTEAFGIEYDHDVHAAGLEMQKELGAGGTLLEGRFEDFDLSGYDFVFINPDKEWRKFQDTLLAQLSDDVTIAVYNNVFLPEKLPRLRTVWPNPYVPVTLYTKRK